MKFCYTVILSLIIFNYSSHIVSMESPSNKDSLTFKPLSECSKVLPQNNSQPRGQHSQVLLENDPFEVNKACTVLTYGYKITPDQANAICTEITKYNQTTPTTAFSIVTRQTDDQLEIIVADDALATDIKTIRMPIGREGVLQGITPKTIAKRRMVKVKEVVEEKRERIIKEFKEEVSSRINDELFSYAKETLQEVILAIIDKWFPSQETRAIRKYRQQIAAQKKELQRLEEEAEQLVTLAEKLPSILPNELARKRTIAQLKHYLDNN